MCRICALFPSHYILSDNVGFWMAKASVNTPGDSITITTTHTWDTHTHNNTQQQQPQPTMHHTNMYRASDSRNPHSNPQTLLMKRSKVNSNKTINIINNTKHIYSHTLYMAHGTWHIAIAQSTPAHTHTAHKHNTPTGRLRVNRQSEPLDFARQLPCFNTLL